MTSRVLTLKNAIGFPLGLSDNPGWYKFTFQQGSCCVMIPRKEIFMTRISRVLLLLVLLVFALACNFVTQPFNEAQDVVETVQSLATALPIETIQSFATALPLATIEALPSAMPDIGNAVNPQGEPLSEWNGIPIIPSATSGEETGGLYSFKTTAPIKEVFDYYKAQMADLGWNEFFSMPETGSGALLTYEKDSRMVTITITADGTGSLVFLTYQ